MSDRIRLLDYVSGDAFEELLTNAMLLVLPSDLEGVSRALLEAMGAGLCVLVSDIPENCELVDGVGFTFKRGDVFDMEHMLRLLIADDLVRKAAKQRIQKQYLWTKLVAEIEQAYLEMAGWENRDLLSPALAGHASKASASTREPVA